MSLNIKNERTHALVRELAERAGMSQTGAVEDAVRRRLLELGETAPSNRARPAFSPAEIAQRVAAMERIAAEFRSVTSDDQRAEMARHADWLYDEHGLPA